jgi:hypothetical protein
MDRTPSFCALLILFAAASSPQHRATGAPHLQLAPHAPRGSYPHIETSFNLPGFNGDPFDSVALDVQVRLRRPDGTSADVPAFFDGGATWRMRYTPLAPGAYSVTAVLLNGRRAQPASLQATRWDVTGSPGPGFVRLDPADPNHFVFDNGQAYYPLGHNQAWRDAGMPDIPALFAKMGAAGENWSRVWMNHWDNKNLDWPVNGRVKPGDVDLGVARRWDAIVAAAERSGIHFQMTLQHHGQYSTGSDPNWRDNPYNAANGGFLKAPADFFTDPTARALTRRKYRYILARWGYSPVIMAFELFNEVENTDAAQQGRWAEIAAWHREMAAFLRANDLNRHLITTSALPGVALDNPVWQSVDYFQAHTYPFDVLATTGAPVPDPARQARRPYFIGEFGSVGGRDNGNSTLHNGLWASLMSDAAGAAQYWNWDNVERMGLYTHYRAASAFLAASGLPSRRGLRSMALVVSTPERAALAFEPGGGWGAIVEQYEFAVTPAGAQAAFSRFPAYLQGQFHRDLMPRPLALRVHYDRPGRFELTAGQVAKAGARLRLSAGGRTVERDFPAAANDYRPAPEAAKVAIDVPAGDQTITIESTGSDWVRVGRFTLSEYAPALGASARLGSDFAAVWIYRRAHLDAPEGQRLQPAGGTLALPGPQPARYRVTWWDTRSGRPLRSEEVENLADRPLTITIPPVERDMALFAVRR